MIEIHSDNSPKIFGNQTITKVKSIIITTDCGDIVLAPCKNAAVSLKTTKTFGSLSCVPKNEATIEAEFDSIIAIK